MTYQGTPGLLTPGDSSAFSGAVPAIAVAIQFDSATSSWSTPGIATILVDRAGNTSGTVSVGFATADGTAVAGVDYASTSGSLTFAPGVTTQSISVPLLDARIAVGDFAFTITLSTPAGGATLGTPATTTVIIDVDNQGGQYHIYIVDTNSGAVVQDGTNSGSLPWAIAQSNANPSSSPALPNGIVFEIPGTGVQTISPIAVLPTIIQPVEIDGYSQPGSQTNTPVTGDTATILVQIDGSQLVGQRDQRPDDRGLRLHGQRPDHHGLQRGRHRARDSVHALPPRCDRHPHLGQFHRGGPVQCRAGHHRRSDPESGRQPGRHHRGLLEQ